MRRRSRPGDGEDLGAVYGRLPAGVRTQRHPAAPGPRFPNKRQRRELLPAAAPLRTLSSAWRTLSSAWPSATLTGTSVSSTRLPSCFAVPTPIPATSPVRSIPTCRPPPTHFWPVARPGQCQGCGPQRVLRHRQRRPESTAQPARGPPAHHPLVFGALPGRPFRAENGVVVARRCRSSLVRERPSARRARGAAFWALHCCLRARELDSLLSQQLLRATTFGSWITPSGGSHVGADAGRAGDHRALS